MIVYIMKLCVQLALAAILLALLYSRPHALVNAVDTTLGKATGVVLVGTIASYFGIGAGILAAGILIVLIESTHEGMKNHGKTGKRGKKKRASKRACKEDKDCGSTGKCHEGICRVTVTGTSQVAMEDQVRKGAEKATLGASKETLPGLEKPHTQTNQQEAFSHYF